MLIKATKPTYVTVISNIIYTSSGQIAKSVLTIHFVIWSDEVQLRTKSAVTSTK